jgi:peroxiredoxin
VKWHSFTGPESQMPAPDFCLTSSAGDTLCDFTYRQRVKQVVTFVSGGSEPEWMPALDALSDRAEHLNRQNTAVLALVPAEPEAIRGLGKDMPYYYPILADRGTQVRRAYEELLRGDTGTGDLVFVLDTFGAPYAAAVNAKMDDPALYDQVSQWLTFISIQCPE